MTAVGIVAEYNPFHLGHAWHLAETRRLYNARKGIYRRVADVAVRSPRISEVLEKLVKSI